MATTADHPASKAAGWRARLDAAIAGLAIVLLATSAMRLTIGVDWPLWLDEAQSGMVVSQPTLADFIRQCTYDINAPLYYVLARIWAQFAGISDHALRSLPAVLGLIAPLIALVPRSLIDRPTRFTWCALLACWIPGIMFSQEARCYTLVLALGVANAVAFVALLRNPTRRTAWAWTTVSSLLILAHYYGAVLVAFQGPVYLFIHKRRAFATWPAALAFLPAVASLAVHASLLVQFTSPGTTWIPLLQPKDLFFKAGFVFGNSIFVFAVLIWLAVALAVRIRAGSLREMFRIETEDRLWIVSACSIAATLLAVGLGFLFPISVDRYLTGFVPGIFLGVAKFANRFERRSHGSATALVALFFAFTTFWAVWLSARWDLNSYNSETASNALMPTRPTRLVFLWDNPMSPQIPALEALGGFFFARAGHPVPVEAVVVPKGADPSRFLLSRASLPGSAILWIYNWGIPGTLGTYHRPAIQKIDPAWACRDFGRWRYKVIACSRDPGFRLRGQGGRLLH